MKWTRTMSRLGAIVLTGMMLLANNAQAQSRWQNHLDASAIREIVYSNGDLFMATNGGLLVHTVSDGTFQQFDNVAGLPSNDLSALVFDGSGNLYVGTRDIGIAKVRFQGGELVLVRALNAQIDGLSTNNIATIIMRGNEVVYGGDPGMGTIVDDFPTTPFFERDGLPDDNVRDVLLIDDLVWTATDGGVVALDRLNIIHPIAGAPAQANVIGYDGQHVWVGTDNGVQRFDPSDSSWTDLGLPLRRVQSFHSDGTTMWTGTPRNLWRYTGSGQNWEINRLDQYIVSYGLDGGKLANAGLAGVPGGDMYIGGEQASIGRGYNLARFDGTAFSNLFAATPAAGDLRRMSLDVDGSLWVSYFEFFVGKLTPEGSWVNYNSTIPASDSLSDREANLAFLADSQGQKWFCTLASPTDLRTLDQLDDKVDADYSNDTWVHHALGSGGGDRLNSVSLQRAREDPEGNRWFLSTADHIGVGWVGIHILRSDGSAWLEVSPRTAPGMIPDAVTDVAFGDGFTYVALRDSGIQRWIHGGFDWGSLTASRTGIWQEPVIVPDDIPAVADILSLARRDDGVLWIGTTGGVYKLSAMFDELTHIPDFKGFGVGLLSPLVSDLALDREGNLWVATALGLNRVARDNDNDIEAFSTPAAYQAVLSALRYPFDVISPLSHADCKSLLADPNRDVLYIGTLAGLSVLDYSAEQQRATDLSKVYVYPNPVYPTRGHRDVKIQNLSGPVAVDIYNVEGELVHTQQVSENGESIWDLATIDGFVASSGVYFIRITTSEASIIKPISLVR